MPSILHPTPTRNLLLALSIAGAISLTTTQAYARSISSQDFVHKASIANEFEIESSQLALEKSQNDNVKTFAQQMVDDHSKAGKSLQEVLQEEKSNVHPADGLDSAHKKMLGKLQSYSGNKFDREYVSMQTKAHKEAVNLFGNYSKYGKDTGLKNFAARTLPTLEGHLEHVRALKSTR